MAEVMAHDWMQGETPSVEEIKASFAEREKEVGAALEAEKQQRDLEKQQRVGERRTRMQQMRSANLQVDSQAQ